MKKRGNKAEDKRPYCADPQNVQRKDPVEKQGQTGNDECAGNWIVARIDTQRNGEPRPASRRDGDLPQILRRQFENEQASKRRVCIRGGVLRGGLLRMHRRDIIMDINAVARIDDGRIDIEQQENEKKTEKKQRDYVLHESHTFQRHTRSWGRWYGGGVFSFLYSRTLHP